MEKPPAASNPPVESLFEPVMEGAFLQRWGAGKAGGAPCSNKKLCFVATDRALLAETLLELSRRPDCYYVKYSTRAKDGMFLGRCFLSNEEAVGRLWQLYKCHPRFMCTVQDDDFAEAFRDRPAP